MGRKFIDLTGQIFGNWTIVKYLGWHKRTGRYLCKCTCGTERSVARSSLKSGDSTSCGCAFLDQRRQVKRKPKGVAAFNRVLTRYKKGSRSRDIAYDLTDEEVRALTQAACHYCGIPPSQQYFRSPDMDQIAREWDTFVYNGIDRKDNTIGYTPGNSVSCCGVCNFMKRRLGYDKFVQQCVKISENLASKREAA